MKTYVDVINETVDYYSEDPVERRSVDETDSSCKYNGPGGRQCAFARCANPIDEKYEGDDVSMIFHFEPNILKDEYKHLENPDFWLDIQTLHDCLVYWNDEGLSEDGRKKVDEFINKYKDEP